MKALFCRFAKVDLSYTYDGLTIYPKFDLSQKDSKKMILNACSKLKFVKVKKFRKKDAARYNQCHESLKHQQNVIFDKVIQRKDDNHDFYHHDELDSDKPHFHLKFHQMLSREQVVQLLDVFVHHEILSEQEKNIFLLEYELRYKTVRQALLEDCTGQIENDEKVIIDFIRNCTDNDILADLHDYMVKPIFDYLRNGALSKDVWVGMNYVGREVYTNKTWAMIEKCISLKMAMNVAQNVFLTPALGDQIATQLHSTHSFFAMKHKATATQKTNKAYNALKMGDEDQLKRSYRKNLA